MAKKERRRKIGGAEGLLKINEGVYVAGVVYTCDETLHILTSYIQAFTSSE